MIEAKCSFCGKKQSQVRKVVAGPDDVCICNECISLCVEIMSDEGIPMANRGVIQATVSDQESDGWRWNDPHWKQRVSVYSVLALTIEALRRGIGLRDASAATGDSRLTLRALMLVDVLNALYRQAVTERATELGLEMTAPNGTGSEIVSELLDAGLVTEAEYRSTN